jgi:hypothetical protein
LINLRYHIISITAVFLALGIGLTLGSTFLDRVTVDTLKSQLDAVEAQVDQTRTDNRALSDRVHSLEERDAGLAEELPERLLAGHLDAVPVLLVATRGTDEPLVAATVKALSAAGAQVAGTWWLTDRWALEDDSEVGELASLLDIDTEDADRLRRNAAIRLAELLAEAAQPPAEAEQPVGPEPGVLDPGGEPPAPTLPTLPVRPEPGEPALVAGLVDAGFLDYQALPGSGDERVLLPGAGARYVVISGSAPEGGPQLFATAVLDELVADGTAPAVAAQGRVDLPGADDPTPEDASRTSFVGPLRDGEITRDRLSTVDDLDTAAGLAGIVLAVEDLGELRTGHYGVAPGAARLLPGADPER